MLQNKKGKKVAAAPLAVKKPEVKRVSNPLFEKRPRSFGIGQDIQVCSVALFNMTDQLLIPVLLVCSPSVT